MPLHGKLVVIKRSGGDGTEFPLTAACLFGRRSDCDIRIQLPQVSKEHCRIDFNENKEIILTNLSSSCPTRVNGETLLQSERLKHGDVITVFDRSFRFEYPPAPTPKKRPAKTETLKVLQDQQVVDAVATETGEKITEVSTDPHLKDGTNHDNIQRSLEKTAEVEAKEDDSLLQSKTASPFGDLYQMIKQSLDVKTPRKSSASMLQTPASRFCTPKPGSVRKNDGNPIIFTEDKSTPKKDEARVPPVADETKGEAENVSNGTPKSVKKQRRSFQVPSTEMAKPEAESAAKCEATSPQKRSRTPPKRFTACEVIEQISATPPVRRRSKEAKPAVTKEQEEQAATCPKADRRASPRNSGKVEKVKETSKKRKSGELAADLPAPQIKKKRVSFGGFLCPELFDKRLPPDSPLCKGATPRRSLCASKPKKSLLRRASVIGLLQDTKEHPDSPKMRTPSPKKSSGSKNTSPKTPTPGKTTQKSRPPSPKAATPAKKSPKSKSLSPKAVTPAKKSPKSRSPSPKAATPAKKSPKSRSPSPNAATPAKKSPKSKSLSPKAVTLAKKSPKSRSPSPKAATPAKNSPKSKSPSPKAATLAKTPKSKSPSPARGRSPSVAGTPGAQTPKVHGRFSVSHISTPSPVAEDEVTDQVPSVTVTPKISQRRKSTSRETPRTAKSAAKVMHRRSGISRASMKFKNSWADIVKFGQTKAEVVAPAKKTVTKKTRKKTVSKPQTPARKLKDLVSTGHADSPVSIVVGRAHKLKVVHPSGAAPKLVTNVAVFKRNMKMDEDLTGISEMLKTPVNPRKTRSVINEINAAKTPEGTSVVEPSVLNTPEEPGEMMVSPLSISSTVKDRSYNREAVKRLLDDDQESSVVSDTPASDDSCEQQCTESKTTSVTTPKQKPMVPECLTGVKRIMKTPRQKAEPVEDLRGRLLKTPKQKPEQQECLSGVKRIMKTPKQKAEPVEDLRGRLLKTPKQKPEQQECLTGVKRIMKTPKQKAEPVEDLRGKILKTPKQKPEQQECLTGVKRMMKTPKQKAEPVEDLRRKILKTPKQKPEQQECLTGVKRMMKTPRREAEPVEDIKVELRTSPKHTPEQQEAELLEDLLEKPLETPKALEAGHASLDDVKELVETLRPTCNAPVEDSEGLQELMEEPVTEPTVQLETNEVSDKTPLDCDDDVAKELDFAPEESHDDVVDALQADIEEEADANEVPVDNHLEEVPSGPTDSEASGAMETISQAAVDENLSEEQPKVDTVDEDVSEDQPKVDTVDEDVSEEQPKEDTVDEDVSEDQPKVDTVDEDVSEEQPKEDTVDEDVSEEQPKEDTVDEDVSEEQPKEDTVDEDVSEEQPKVDTVNEDVSEEQPKVDTVDKDVSEEQPKVDTVDEDVSEEQSKEDTVNEDVSEEQPKVDTVDEDVSEEQPKVDTVDEDVSEEQPKVDTVDEDVSEEQPKVDTVDEDVSDEQPKVDTVDEDVSEEQPKVDTVDEDVSEEQPKVDTVDEDVSEEQSKEDTVNEDVSEEQPKVDTVDEDVSEEQSKVDTVDEDVSDEQPKVDTVDEDVSEEQPKVDTASGNITEVDTAATDRVHEKKPGRGRKAKTVESKAAEDKQEAAEHTEEPVVPVPVRGRRGKKAVAAAPPAVKKTTRGRNAKKESTPDEQPEIEPEKAVETLATEVSTEAVSDQTSPVKENDSTPPAEEAVGKPVRGRKTKQSPVEPEPEQNEAVSDAQPEQSVPTVVKPRRGRKTKPDTVEQNELAEDAIVVVETKQQPPVRTKRGRNAKQEEESVETTKSQEPAKKLRRTRKAEQDQSSEDQAEIVQEVEMVPEPESKQSPLVDVKQEANDSAAPLEKAASKPRRGRKPKQAEQSVPEQQDVPSTHSDDVPQADTTKDTNANEFCSDQLEVVPSGSDENKSSDVMETVLQTPETESQSEVETATCEVTEVVAAVVQKKPGRGRRAKTVECKSAEDKQEAAEHTEDPVVPVPVRGRRGKKAEAAAPPAVTKMTRGRRTMPQGSTTDEQPETEPEKAVETLATEVSTEAVSDQTSPVKENDSTPPAEEAVGKPVRGRKTKQSPVEPEPEQNEAVSDAQPEQSVPTVVKPRRGRKTKADTVEQNELGEDTVVAEETKQQHPVRAKRGRNAKQEEESVETTKSQEPAKKIRTRKAEQDPVEPREEAVEMVVPEEGEAPVVAEPMKMNEQATKPRRGRKTKQDPESETPVEEVPAVSATDKVKRGRRGKQVTEEAGATAVVTEEKPEELEAEEENEPDAPVIKQSRARGSKTSAKSEVSQAAPAKRARRGAALPLEETNAESTVLVSEPASTSVEEAKRERRAAAKPTADSNSAAVEDAKTSKKSVKWKANLEDIEILKATPVKAVRGRKSKFGDTESKNVSKDADKTEETDLSDKVVEAQPVKRARRGAKVAEVESVEADAQPKTRRGRQAKK